MLKRRTTLIIISLFALLVPAPDVADFGRFAAATTEHFRGRVDR